MYSQKRYNATADILRILAIFAVIAIHTTTKTLDVSNFAVQKIPFTIFLNQIFRLAVPLFFIISGFVLELNYHLHENYFTYLRKRLNRILVPYIFWSAIYYYFIYHNHASHYFFRALLLGDASYQLYFIPALLFFYFIFPLIHKFFNVIGHPLMILFLFVIQLILLYIDYHIHALPLFLPMKVVLLNYFPFILGVFLSKNYEYFIAMIKKWKIYFFIGAVLFGFYIFYQGVSGYVITHNYLMIYSQWRPSVLLYTIFLGGFLYWVFDRDITHEFVIKKIAQLSLFVFFIHVLILEFLWISIGTRFFELEFVQNLWWDPLFFLSVTLLSFLIAYIVHKVPYLSKITG